VTLYPTQSTLRDQRSKQRSWRPSPKACAQPQPGSSLLRSPSPRLCAGALCPSLAICLHTSHERLSPPINLVVTNDSESHHLHRRVTQPPHERQILVGPLTCCVTLQAPDLLWGSFPVCTLRLGPEPQGSSNTGAQWKWEHALGPPPSASQSVPGLLLGGPAP
jgi:hypothetical protein